MGITTSTSAGRAQLQHPDLGHDGGATLWNKVQTMFAKIGDSLAVQWFGPFTVANGGTQDVVHNFSMNLSELEVHVIESDVVLTQEQQAVYGIAEKVGNLKNALTITNNSGGSKTFSLYVLGFSLDNLLGRQKARIVTTDGSTTTLMTIPIPANESMAIDVLISCRKDGTTANVYRLLGMAENNAGTVAIRTTEKTTDEDISTYDALLTIDGLGNVLVRVIGEAATSVEWYGVAQKTYF